MPSYRHLSGKKSTWFRQEIDPRPGPFELPALLIHGFDLLLQRSLQISFQNLHRLGLAVVEAHVVGREGELLHGQSGVAGAPPEDRRRRRHRRARRRRRATVHRRRFPSLSISPVRTLVLLRLSSPEPATIPRRIPLDREQETKAKLRTKATKRERERESGLPFQWQSPLGLSLKIAPFAPAE